MSVHHLIANLVFWSCEQLDGGPVNRSSILGGCLREEGLIGRLNLAGEVINKLISTIFRHWLSMPVILIFNACLQKHIIQMRE